MMDFMTSGAADALLVAPALRKNLERVVVGCGFESVLPGLHRKAYTFSVLIDRIDELRSLFDELENKLVNETTSSTFAFALSEVRT
jgi:hypothetical protein